MEDEKPDVYSKYPSLGSDDEYMSFLYNSK
jgi:hypothetical protein